MFLFADRDPATGTPAALEGAAYRLLAEPGGTNGWGVYEVALSSAPGSAEPVSEELAVLLASAVAYPPAMALTRERVARDARLGDGAAERDREEFSLRLCGLLEAQLDGAPRRGHLLARSLVDAPGLRAKGAYYWLVGYSPPSDLVRWVGDDLDVHEDEANSFALDGHMLVTLVEQQLLVSCAHDAELFYFPFAAVNYGGQVSRREDGNGRSRYEDDGPWPIAFDGATIAAALERLVRAGLMRCWRLSEDGQEREELHELDEDELEVYDDYECLTFHDHTEALGYGPHSFITTDAGLKAAGMPPRHEE